MPHQNAFVESFNGRFRDECLNGHGFRDLEDARKTIEAWRRDFSAPRPRSALGYMTPEEFASSHRGYAPDGMTTSAKRRAISSTRTLKPSDRFWGPGQIGDLDTLLGFAENKGADNEKPGSSGDPGSTKWLVAGAGFVQDSAILELRKAV